MALSDSNRASCELKLVQYVFKGIEKQIDANPHVNSKESKPYYLIAGQNQGLWN